MKEFFVGLAFLVFVGIFAIFGILTYPLLLLIAFVLRILLSVAVLIFFIWLVGKFILFLSKK